MRVLCSDAGLTFIPAPKPKLPGHEASYNPPKEYLPTEVGSHHLHQLHHTHRMSLLHVGRWAHGCHPL